MNHHPPRTVAVFAALGLAFTAALSSGCTDDATPSALPKVDDDVSVRSTTTLRPAEGDHGDHGDHGEDDAMQVTVEGVDYAFSHLPDKVAAGTRLSFQNTSVGELHEMAVFRIPDDVDTPIDDLTKLAPAELESTLGAPVTVAVQPPGAPESIVAVGDGTLTKPGRYAVMCFIPIGADPGEYLAAAQAAGGGKPEGVAGGPPHFTAGMYAELTVE